MSPEVPALAHKLSPWRSEPRLLLASKPPSAGHGAGVAFVIAGESGRHDQAMEWAVHTHEVHELLWVRRGLMRVQVGQQWWAMPSNAGMWIPAGVEHAGLVSAGAEFQASFFAPEHSRFTPTGPVAVDISPLLHELLKHLAQTNIASPARAHAEQVVFDNLAPSPHASFLSVPQDPRLGPIARYLFDHPEDQRTLAQWAASAGVSEKTLARAFAAATGQTFAQWRLRLRVHVALSLLALGLPVAEVAEEVGYNTASSFIVAFRQVTGMTPGQHQRQQMSV